MSLFLLVVFLFSSILNSFPHTHHSHNDSLQVKETNHSHSHPHHHHCNEHTHNFDFDKSDLDFFTTIINNHSHSSNEHSHSNMITHKSTKQYSLVFMIAIITVNFDNLLFNQNTTTFFDYIPCLYSKIHTTTCFRRGPPLSTY